MSTDARRRLLAIILITGLMVAVSVTAAGAHPVFRPDRVEPGTTETVELLIPHGCSSDGSIPTGFEGGFGTTVLAVQTPDGPLDLEPVEADGWRVEIDEDGWQWVRTANPTNEPLRLPVHVTADPGAHEAIRVALFQACEDGAPFRWVEVSSATPAPSLGLGVDAETDAAGGGSAIRVLLLAIGLAGVATWGVLYARRQRT